MRHRQIENRGKYWSYAAKNQRFQGATRREQNKMKKQDREKICSNSIIC
jgi:hypothetical protein